MGTLIKQNCSKFRLNSYFCKFNGRYNDHISNCSLPLGRMLTGVFHTNCQNIINHPMYVYVYVFPTTTRSKRQLWPVSRGCILLHGTWSYLYDFFYRSVFALVLFVFYLWAFDFEHCALLPHVILEILKCWIPVPTFINF